MKIMCFTHFTGYPYTAFGFNISLLTAGRWMSRSWAFHSSLVLKIQNKLRDMSQSCLQWSSTQPKRDYHIARVCLQRGPSRIQKHNSPLRFFFQLYCTSICIQRGPLGLSPSAIHPGNEVFMTQDFAFWCVTPIFFNLSPAGATAAMAKIKKWAKKQSQTVSVMSFYSVCHTY